MLGYKINEDGTHNLTVDGQQWTVPDGVLNPELEAIVIGHLICNWHRLEGGRETGMNGDKVHRAEELRFEKGHLLFDIERHAGTMNGSTRADVYTWVIHPDGNSAGIARKTHRQLQPRARSYTKKDARKDAFGVMRILNGRRKNRGEAELLGDGKVVIYAYHFADLGEFNRTIIGRRKQFLAALKDVVQTRGWEVVRSNVYESSRITLAKTADQVTRA